MLLAACCLHDDPTCNGVRMKKTFLSVYISLGVIITLAALTGCSEDASPVSTPVDTLSYHKQTAVAVVHSHAVMLGVMLQGIKDEQARIAFIRSAIDSVRFYDDRTGYFYVYDYECWNIAHATQKNLQGTLLYDYQDTKGNYVIRLLSAAARLGGGFVEFWWIKPGSTGEKRKLGYVEPIPWTNYFIGTGVYME
jgi:signal transduction histidine kinase